ncbi:MAG: cell division protein FtsL [Spirochaetaceae bacterium]|jgi:cell division protein FtsL|nr:cell division protein FtsL [Spirochaetaceae bacterium]
MKMSNFTRFFLYAVALTIPVAMGLITWQSTRYAELKREIERNNRLQADYIEQNTRLITEISALSAAYRIENLAKTSLGLDKTKPEDVIHVSIYK